MLQRTLTVLLAILAASVLSGCELIGDILAFGFWTGVVVVVIVVAIIWAILRRIGGRRRI